MRFKIIDYRTNTVLINYLTTNGLDKFKLSYEYEQNNKLYFRLEMWSIGYENPVTYFIEIDNNYNDEILGLDSEYYVNKPVYEINNLYDVNYTTDLTLYVIFKKYRPFQNSITINLYQNEAEKIEVDKTNFLYNVGTINCVIKEPTSLTKPSLIISQDSLPNFNYIYIQEFNRYYFVENIATLYNKVWEIYCNVDVLMTYKDTIKQQFGLIERTSNAEFVDVLLDDEQILVNCEPRITQTRIDTTNAEITFDPDKYFGLKEVGVIGGTLDIIQVDENDNPIDDNRVVLTLVTPKGTGGW